MNIRQQIKRDLTQLVNLVRKDERTSSSEQGRKLMKQIAAKKKAIMTAVG